MVPNAVCIATWAATGAANFWPKRVLVFTGIWYGVFLIRYLAPIERERADAAAGIPATAVTRDRAAASRRRRYHG